MDLAVSTSVVKTFARLLFLSACLWASVVNARAPAHLAFRHIQPEQVAAIGYITAIAQDSAGFMWFGGANGLARYDGYNIKIYRQDDSLPGSLSNSYINDLRTARDGSLWVATRAGLHQYDATTDRFTHYRVPSDNPRGLSANDINSMLEDDHGNFWLGTRGGFLYFDRKTGRFDVIEESADTMDASDTHVVWRVVRDHDGKLWLAHQTAGISRYDPVSQEFTHYAHNPAGQRGPSFPDVRELYVDSTNTLWAGTYGGGLNRYNRSTDSFEVVAHDANEKGVIVWSVVEDGEGNLWVGDGSAVYRRAPGSDHFERFTHHENDATTPGNYVINRLFEDRTGDMWVGYFPAGIDMVDRQASVFRNYRYSSTDTNSVSDGGVLSAIEDKKGNLWIGTGYGLTYFDRANNRFTRMHPDPADPNSLSGNTILSMTEDSRAQLWLGVWSGGLNRLDRATGKFTHYMPRKGDPTSLLGREPWSVIEDSRGDIWVASEEGVSRYQYATDSFTHFSPPLEQLDGDTQLYARVVYEDKRGNLWVGGLRGLFLLDRDTGTFTRYHHHADTPNSLPVDFVLSIYEDGHDNLWVGTDSGGVSLFDREQKTFTTYTAKDGLANTVVASIMDDADGDVWLGTQKGLSRFNISQKTFRNYDKRHGLNDNLFNRNAPLRTRAGEMLFGNSNGFTLFNPARLTNNNYVPAVVITELHILNKPAIVGAEGSPLKNTIAHTKSITLTPEQSVFSLEFSALSYRMSEENNYAYRLLGFSDEWQHIGAKRTATYTNLDSGSYVFEVKGANNDGVWSREPVRLEIKILPPLWKTWWAYALYVCLLLLLLYWFRHVQRIKFFYEKQKLAQERLVVKRLTELDKLKDEFLANTSHELRTPLNGIIGLAESLIDGATGELPGKARYNLAMIVSSGNRLASLVDDILDFAKLKNKGLVLRKKALDLYVLVDIVLALSQPLVTKKPVQLINRVPKKLPAVYADEDRLIQIFHNLIGNAAKFTDHGSIVIAAEQVENAIVIHVIDTGIGIPAEKLKDIFASFQQLTGSSERDHGGTGLGLSITRQLVELHEGNIQVESTFGEGSRFSFSLPITDSIKRNNDLNPNGTGTRELPRYHQILMDERLATPDVQPAAAGNREKILIVDDDPINRQVLVNYLQLHNYFVVEATSGEEAINLIDAGNNFDMVLLDIMMPRQSGYQTCKILREKYPSHELPIILLTARNQMSDLVMSFDVGANDFLTKPIAKEELLARVATHLQLHDVTRTLDNKVAERTEELHLKNEGLHQAQMALQDAYRKLEEASLSDPLTGLHNRRFLKKFIGNDVGLVEREYSDWLAMTKSEPAAPKLNANDLIFMLLDVDHFKAVNDNHGHSAGDRVLEQLSRLLKAVLRESDYLVRWGGEEFLVVARFTARAEAQEMAERIRQAVAAHQFDVGNGCVLQKTCSIGFASYPFYERAPSALSWEQVIDTADRALYAAKKSGRNCCVGLSASTATMTFISPATCEDLPALIAQGIFCLSSSPNIDTLEW